LVVVFVVVDEGSARERRVVILEAKYYETVNVNVL